MTTRSEPRLESLSAQVAQALERAQRLGATEADASASFGSGLTVTVRMREVETLEYHRDQGLSITVYMGKRKGSASTSDLSAAALEETVAKACALARFAAEDPSAGLPDAQRLAQAPPDLDLWHPWPLEPPGAIELATECEAAALEADRRITNSEGATVTSHSGCRVLGNTLGFLHGYRSSQHSVSCAVLASDGHGMERDFDYTVARHPDELASAVSVGRESAARALRRLGATKVRTATVPVLFPARLARGLFGHLVGAVSGGSLYRGASFLADSLDRSVFADCVSIAERPHIRRGLGSAPFDDEGVATADRMLVEAGTLRGYVLGSYYARKLGMASTGNAGGVHNLVVESTGESYADLLAGMERGFVVTELMGQGVNLVTGDYSRGAAGFWVERGALAHPVSEVTVAGNLAEMYRRIAAIGSDVDVRGGIRTGSVLVEAMTVAGS